MLKNIKFPKLICCYCSCSHFRLFSFQMGISFVVLQHFRCFSNFQNAICCCLCFLKFQSFKVSNCLKCQHFNHIKFRFLRCSFFRIATFQIVEFSNAQLCMSCLLFIYYYFVHVYIVFKLPFIQILFFHVFP